MGIWLQWWSWSKKLRGSCSRTQTFYWLLVALIGFSIRDDLLGVSSFIRCIGMHGCYYDRVLDFFHSPALNVQELGRIWTAVVFEFHPGIVRCGGMPVLVCDGLKIGKSGRKMPGVKLLHQESESNTKPEYIMGHSCQAVCVLVQGLSSIVALPLAAEIHEGVVTSNRDRRTLLDKMAALVFRLGIEEKFILLADAYYASKKIILALLEKGCHLISRVKSNAVAYYPAPPPAPGKRGRRKIYGDKIRLASLFDNEEDMTEAESPIYGEKNVTLRYRTLDLLWRPVGIKVRFVAVIHPSRGKCLLMSTSLALVALEIIRLYGLRFKIEVSFKQAIHNVGAYLYHFWMAAMKPLKRRSGNQYMHKETEHYRQAVRRKLGACHCFLQMGLIAQGLLQMLAILYPDTVWQRFGSWLRTIRPGVAPSEQVVALALRESLPEIIAGFKKTNPLVKIISENLDIDRAEGWRLAS